MAEVVTYADLRFAKSAPPEKSRPPPGDACGEAGDDGELTYENVPAAPNRQPRSPDPTASPGDVRRRLWPGVPLALLVACLFLLATCLGLGVRYWQVSGQLRRASQRHTAESGALALRLGSQEQNLTHSLAELSRAQAELSATSLALQLSWQVGNSTRQELEQVQRGLASLQEEKSQAVRELEEARSCQRTGCCPQGWTPFRWKCLWVSSKRTTWEGARRDCENRQAQLLVLKPWDAHTIQEALATPNRLQSDEFWVGLRKMDRQWCWIDGSRFTGTLEPGYYYYHHYYAKVSQGILTKENSDSNPLQYVCETVARPFPEMPI
ncbi:B-cell differentiation antigen CD72 [Paroedura picta]|uniref:B-cell differentiation antigen CD72 n=1 Tax=Paroedura picta TaxID=143630 RepID=UPI001015C8F4